MAGNSPGTRKPPDPSGKRPHNHRSRLRLPWPLVETELPGYVEITVFDQPEAGRLVVSLLNLPSELPPPEFRDCRVRLRISAEGGRPERLTLAPEGIPPVQWFYRDGTVKFTLDRLHCFAMILIEY